MIEKLNTYSGFYGLVLLGFMAVGVVMAQNEHSPTGPFTIVVDPGRVLSDMSHGPLGFNACWLTDSDEGRPERKTSTMSAYRSLGTRTLRFPYGTLGDNYLWHTGSWEDAVKGLRPRVAAIGTVPTHLQWPDLVRPDGSFINDLDFDGFISMCRNIGAEPVIMVNACGWHHDGGPTVDALVESAAEWVRYANKVKSYQVRYWEIGNEVEGPFGMDFDRYLTTYLRFRTAMQDVDPTVRVGFGAHTDKRWFEEAVRRHPDKVDFLVAHPYLNEFRTHDDFLAHDGSTLLVKRTEDAVNAIRKHGGMYRDKIPVFVTEASSYSFQRTWQNHQNNMTKALAWFEMAGNMLCMPEVRYIHFWTGHSPWSGRDSKSMDMAMTWDNRVLPMGFTTGILANHLRHSMVECTRVAGHVRAYASGGTDGLTVWLSNKDRASRSGVVRMAGANAGKSSVLVMCFSGKNGSPEDWEYTWTKSEAWVLTQDGLRIDLPPCSITVVTLSNSEAPPPGTTHGAQE